MTDTFSGQHELDGVFQMHHFGKAFRSAAATATAIARINAMRRARDEEQLRQAAQRNAQEHDRLQKEMQREWRRDHDAAKSTWDMVGDPERWRAADLETKAKAFQLAAGWSADSPEAERARDTFKSRIEDEYGIDVNQFVAEEISGDMSQRRAMETLTREPEVSQDAEFDSEQLLKAHRKETQEQQLAASHILSEHAPQWYLDGTRDPQNSDRYVPRAPADAIRDARDLLNNGDLDIRRQREVWYDATRSDAMPAQPTPEQSVNHWLATEGERQGEFTNPQAQTPAERHNVPTEHVETVDNIVRQSWEEIGDLTMSTHEAERIKAARNLEELSAWDRATPQARIAAVAAATQVTEWRSNNEFAPKDGVPELAQTLNDRLLTQNNIDYRAVFQEHREGGIESSKQQLAAGDTFTFEQIDQAREVRRAAAAQNEREEEAARIIMAERAPRWYQEAAANFEASAAPGESAYAGSAEGLLAHDMREMVSTGKLSLETQQASWQIMRSTADPSAAHEDASTYWERTADQRPAEQPHETESNTLDAAMRQLNDEVQAMGMDDLRSALDGQGEAWLNRTDEAQLHKVAEQYRTSGELPDNLTADLSSARIDAFQEALPQYAQDWINEQRLQADAANEPQRLDQISAAAATYEQTGRIDADLLNRAYDESLTGPAGESARAHREARENHPMTVEAPPMSNADRQRAEAMYDEDRARNLTDQEERLRDAHVVIADRAGEDNDPARDTDDWRDDAADAAAAYKLEAEGHRSAANENEQVADTRDLSNRPEMTDQDHANRTGLENGYSMSREQSLGAARKRGSQPRNQPVPEASRGHDRGRDL